jgi:S1-C subfamily serine protease
MIAGLLICRPSCPFPQNRACDVVRLIDVIFLATALLFGVRGYRQGFIVGALSFLGFLGGGAVALLLVPLMLRSWLPDGVGNALLAVGLVLLVATLAQAAGIYGGQRLRRRVIWEQARAVEAGLGAILGIVALLVIGWFLATSVKLLPYPAVQREIRGSRVVATLDKIMPTATRQVFSSFRALLNQNGFPEVFSGVSPELIVPVTVPDPRVRLTPGVRAAAGSIVKVIGSASCRRDIEGSGFVSAPERVVTNAHVVAGVRQPTVQIGGIGQRYSATVVSYDPKRDVAVLRVPGLPSPPLRFAGPVTRGAPAVVAGFPRNGPYRLDAARVRSTLDARGADIYGSPGVVRSIYSLFATVEPGNSGGPLLDPTGRVLGVVFAESIDDPNTGYALTTQEVGTVVAAGARATAAVGTGRCA